MDDATQHLAELNRMIDDAYARTKVARRAVLEYLNASRADRGADPFDPNTLSLGKLTDASPTLSLSTPFANPKINPNPIITPDENVYYFYLSGDPIETILRSGPDVNKIFIKYNNELNNGETPDDAPSITKKSDGYFIEKTTRGTYYIMKDRDKLIQIAQGLTSKAKLDKGSAADAEKQVWACIITNDVPGEIYVVLKVEMKIDILNVLRTGISSTYNINKIDGHIAMFNSTTAGTYIFSDNEEELKLYINTTYNKKGDKDPKKKYTKGGKTKNNKRKNKPTRKKR